MEYHAGTYYLYIETGIGSHTSIFAATHEGSLPPISGSFTWGDPVGSPIGINLGKAQQILEMRRLGFSFVEVTTGTQNSA